MTGKSVDKPLLRVLAGESRNRSADLADAAGRPISSGIPGNSREGRKFPRSLLQSKTCGGDNVAADPALRIRCGDSFFRYSGGAACARPACGALSKAKDRGSMRFNDPSALKMLRPEIDHAQLAPVYEAIARAKQRLPPAVALLGFCGAPWTVATYMIAGCGTADQLPARLFAYRHPEAFAKLIDLLVEASASYLIRQFEAGVDAVADFRHLGGSSARPMNSADGASSRAPDCRGGAQGDPGRQDHRLSARRGERARTLSRRGRRRCDRARLDGGAWLRARSDSTACGRSRAISIRLRSWSEARRLIARSTRSSKRLRAARSSSISATAFCRRRRSLMSNGWSRACAARRRVDELVEAEKAGARG